jgi:hypothetical protein
MSTPKLREGARDFIISECLEVWYKKRLSLDWPDADQDRIEATLDCILANLHRLLEPNSTTFQIYCDAGQPSKPVAIVEVEDD